MTTNMKKGKREKNKEGRKKRAMMKKVIKTVQSLALIYL